METDNSTAQVDNSIAPEVSGEVNAGIIIESAAPVAQAAAPAAEVKPSSWKSYLRSDLKDSPLSKKFEDTPDGLNKFTEGYANLEKLLGHEKVPIPKDEKDVEGWARYSKAMGVPEKPEGYKLEDAKLPDSMKDVSLDKNKFAEVMHAHKIHPSAVKGIWEAYQKTVSDSYNKVVTDHQNNLTNTVNGLKSEWGDSYNVNVELGQEVISKFSDDQEMNDFVTNSLTKSPAGIKFLAKIGKEFSENKVGDFQSKRFSYSPDEAMEEVRKIKMDLEGPYHNSKGKFTEAEHNAALNRVNSLLASAQRRG